MARIICEVGPSYVLVENSPMLTSRGLGRVLRDLAEMGYNARWGVLGAREAGGFTYRERLWILACPKSQRLDGSEIFKGIRFEGNAKRKNGLPAAIRIEALGRSLVGLPELDAGSDELAATMDQIKAIGNGQVPQVAALAWRILIGGGAK
jgi:DNA (cytosine-5)-methyltransferase 1